MAKDRSEDRHAPGSRHQITLPAPLWDRLGEVVGNGNRSDQIRQLVEAYLCGLPMPALPERDVTGVLVRPAKPPDFATTPNRAGRRRPTE